MSLVERKAAEPSRTQVAAEPPRKHAGHPVAELQRKIGNRGTRQVLAREPAPVKQISAVEVEGVGTIELDSWSIGMPSRNSSSHEAHFMSMTGSHSPTLMRLVLDGNPITAVVRSARDGALTEITFKNASVSSYSTTGAGSDSGPRESWSIVGEMTFSRT